MKGILKFPFVNNKPVISAVPPGSSIDQEQKQHVEGDTEYSAGTKMIHSCILNMNVCLRILGANLPLVCLTHKCQRVIFDSWI